MTEDTAPEPYEFLRNVLAEYQPWGWAIEFGVFSGYSLEVIANWMPVIGLDSFEGLPEDWRADFPKGSFKRLEDLPLPHTTNAMIVPGLFEDTLPLLREWGLPRLGLVHIDCDLYSSTVTALDGIIDAVDLGTILVFDEFQGYEGCYQHEEQAFNEWLARYSIVVSDLAEGEQERAFRIDKIGQR